MGYIIGQIFGLLSTVCSLLKPQFKEKQKMLYANAASNVLVIVNMLLIDGFSSGVMVCGVAVVQSLIAAVRFAKNKAIHKWENILFLCLCVGCGLLGYRGLPDALPILGAVFNVLSTFQRDEQRTRWLLLINVAVFAVYYVIIGSTALLSVLCTFCSVLLGLWRHRKVANREV